MSKISKRPTVRMPSVQEDKAITAAARSDPDAQPLTPTQLKAMVPLKSLRGRPKSENKNNWFQCATAPRCWPISSPPAKAGSRSWTACCANMWPAIHGVAKG